MKLKLTQIINEMKPTMPSYDYVPHAPKKTTPGMGPQPQPEKLSLKQRVDQAQPEAPRQSRDGDMYYKGGVLHREDGPAVVPRGAHVRQLEGGTEIAEGGEYYLYGKKFQDFSVWYRFIEQHMQKRDFSL